ncbi:MAG: hypothetical protein GEU95_06160 [Rhizobiales bacterium]|nr:hypothetical protein [Hyphomicrobiales bacterium]
MMAARVLGTVALLAGLAAFSAGAPATAQDFELVETPSVTKLPVEKMKPKSIAFSDKPDDLVDPAIGFIRYEDWAKARPIQQQFLSLYPGYAEPDVDIIVDGARRRYRERLHMYVAEARFVLSRPPASVDLAQFATLPFAERIDPAIKHKMATADDPARPREARVIHNQHPQRKWCEGREVVICLRSTYKLEGRLPVGIQLANKIREGSRRISDTLEFDSELTVLTAAEVDELGLAKLTQLDTPPVGALEQSIFYVNQAMQFGKLLAIFQAHPTDSAKTVVSVFTALAIESDLLGKQKQFAKVPVLRNLVPAQVLLGKSSFNSGKSLSAGLPVYARNQIRSIAAILEAGGQAADKSAPNPVR